MRLKYCLGEYGFEGFSGGRIACVGFGWVLGRVVRVQT